MMKIVGNKRAAGAGPLYIAFIKYMDFSDEKK
jgi:hypothetical protein